VHRPLGEERQDGRSHVTAAPAAGAAATPPAAPTARAEAEAETRAETRAESGSETGAEVVAGVVAEVFAEFPSGLAPGVVQGAPVNRAGGEAESEAGPAAEWSLGGSEWVAHFLSLRSWITHRSCASEYHDISETNAMQRDLPVYRIKETHAAL
jgi:hypothetical protein